MFKETYERMEMLVTEFSSEDVITTSGEVDPVNPDPHTSDPGITGRRYEIPLDI